MVQSREAYTEKKDGQNRISVCVECRDCLESDVIPFLSGISSDSFPTISRLLAERDYQIRVTPQAAVQEPALEAPDDVLLPSGSEAMTCILAYSTEPGPGAGLKVAQPGSKCLLASGLSLDDLQALGLPDKSPAWVEKLFKDIQDAAASNTANPN